MVRFMQSNLCNPQTLSVQSVVNELAGIQHFMGLDSFAYLLSLHDCILAFAYPFNLGRSMLDHPLCHCEQ